MPCTSAILIENHLSSISGWSVSLILVMSFLSASSWTQPCSTSYSMWLSLSLYNGFVSDGSRPPPISISLSRPLALVGVDTFD